jgi:predicted nucleotidyltransferase
MTRTAADATPGLRPSRVLASHRVDVLELARAHGATNVRVFGSVARNDDTTASDVDLLVDFAPGTSLLSVIGLEQALTDLLGVPVDVGPADALREDIRDRVLAEARPL